MQQQEHTNPDGSVTIWAEIEVDVIVTERTKAFIQLNTYADLNNPQMLLKAALKSANSALPSLLTDDNMDCVRQIADIQRRSPEILKIYLPGPDGQPDKDHALNFTNNDPSKMVKARRRT
jgi:hypothetical protein